MTAFTKNLTDIAVPTESGYSLRFDGSQNYLSLGNLGNFGSSLGSGVYIKFTLQTTQTSTTFLMGGGNSGSVTSLLIIINSIQTGTNIVNRLRVFLRDNSGKLLDAGTAADYNYTDGSPHTFIITINPSTNIVTVSIDGSAQGINYASQPTPSSFSNFANGFSLGARNNNGVISGYTNCTVDDFSIGTSSGVIYASYNFNDGANPIADGSGNANNGTLLGTTLPLFVPGINTPPTLIKATGRELNASISLTESLIRTPQKLLSETTSPTENLVKDIGRLLTGSVTLRETTGLALQFDGIQNYASLGNLGNFGSSMGSGIYFACSFTSSSTALGMFIAGLNAAGTTRFFIAKNATITGTVVAGKIRVFLQDNAGRLIDAGLTNPYSFNDGLPHSLEVKVNPSTNIVTIKIDGVPQSVVYNSQATPAVFSNFTAGLALAAFNNLGVMSTWTSISMDEVKIGNSPAALYAWYNFNDNSNPTTDLSGNNNHATLTGSPLPLFVNSSIELNKLTGKRLTETIAPKEVTGFALSFDGTQNYLSLGNLGDFGSSLVNGLYFSCAFISSSTGLKPLASAGNTAVTRCLVNLNATITGTVVDGKIRVFLRDEGGRTIDAGLLNAYTFNDGLPHTLVVTAIPVTNTVSIIIDGISQSVEYARQDTPFTFIDFVNGVTVGAFNTAGVINNFSNVILEDVKIGISPTNIYASYNFNDNSNPTADSTGNGHNATLMGSPLPLFVNSFIQINKAIVKFPFSESLSLIEIITHQFVKFFTDSISLASNFSILTGKQSMDVLSIYPYYYYVLAEDGSYLLQEDGGRITNINQSFLLKDDGYRLLQDDGNAILINDVYPQFGEEFSTFAGKNTTDFLPLTEFLNINLTNTLIDILHIVDGLRIKFRRALGRHKTVLKDRSKSTVLK